MPTIKNALKVAWSSLVVVSGLAATGVTMAVVGVFLIGLVDWTGGQDSARHPAVQGAMEDSRAEFLPLP